MLFFKVIFTIIVFLICCAIYLKTRNSNNSLPLIIATGLITTIFGNVIIPSNISLFDITENLTDNSKEVVSNSVITSENNSDEKDEESEKEIEIYDTPSPKHKHKKYQTKKENVVNVQCIKKGSYDSVTYCKCGKELKRKTIVVKALGHKYKNGICIRCRHKDPNYVKVYNSEEIMKIFSKSVVSSGAYSEHLGSDTISVFAKDRHNCFSLNTAVSYNLWGGNVQTVSFNASKLKKLKKLKFKIGGETGCSGSIKIEIFINKSFDDKADYVYETDASAIPIDVSINVEKATLLGFRVTNNSSNQNRIVFFKFST